MRRAEHGFGDSRASVSDARRFATATIREWGMDDIGGDVALLVSELVTNAVVHAAGGGIMHLVELEAGVHVEVADGSRTAPVLRRGGPEDASGRGLLMVDRISDAWGVDRRADGKGVWFELTTGREPGSDLIPV